jgi:hypothetical protein
MFEMETPHIQDNKCREEIVLLKDLVSTSARVRACDYLVLSVKCCEEQTCIQITTTDSSPITYMAILPEGDNFDYNSLLFVAQPSVSHGPLIKQSRKNKHV